MNKKQFEVAAHVSLAALAFYEMTLSKNVFRRCLLGACAGWHIGAAYHDLLKEKECESLYSHARI